MNGIPMLNMPVDGQEVRLHCRRPDGVWVTVKALTYRQAVDRVPAGWMFIGAAICDAHASDGWLTWGGTIGIPDRREESR